MRMQAVKSFYSKHDKPIRIISICLLLILFLMPFLTSKRVRLHTSYTSKEDVALYIKKYHELPPNYITKDGYQFLMKEGKEDLAQKYVSSSVIGGDTFFEVEKLASFGVSSDTRLKECDIAMSDNYGMNKESRGSHRLVYTCNEKHTRVFYTYQEDRYTPHYTNFYELTSFKLQLPRNIFWIIFGVYAGLFAVFYGICLYNPQKPKTESIEESSGS